MSEYIPNTDEVRLEYMAVRWAHNETASFEARAEFDRWLAKRDAEVAAKAYERAILDVGLNPDLANQLLDTNPYRKAVRS